MSYVAGQPKLFSRIAGQVLMWAVAGNVSNFFVPTAPIALTVNAICIWRLYRTALLYARSDVEGFDSTVAAEAIVGFGIMSLVFGLVSVALLFVSGRLQIQSASGDLRINDAIPFIEGLATAGAAPFAAILLRLNVSEVGVSVNPADDMASLARAASSLTRTLTDAHAALEQFKSGAGGGGNVDLKSGFRHGNRSRPLGRCASGGQCIRERVWFSLEIGKQRNRRVERSSCKIESRSDRLHDLARGARTPHSFG